MTSRLYVRKGGDIGAGDIELTGFTGRKGIPFFDDDTALIKMGMRCENGEASQGTFKLMDPEAELPRTDFEFNLPAHTLVTWTEDAPGAEIWLSRGRIAQYEGGRGDVTLDNQVEFDGLVDDGNMELRGQAFTEAWVRPAESDFDRVAAVRAYTINGSGSTATEHRDTASVTVSNTHLCPNTNTVLMPPKTYPVGTQPQDVITDCADTAGKIYSVVIHHTGGSHLCLLYILETNHTTFATAAKISDNLADWNPTHATTPVYEPHWEAGKASIYDGNPLLSGLVSIYGTDQSVFVDNANATPYDYWTESFYDSQSVTATQAAAKANGILLYRSLTHVTHRVSIIMQASQLALIHAGMSIQIKSAAAMGGQYLDTYQTRRIAECQFEPRHDGTYWAHLALDRTPHTPRGGKAQPAASTPKPAPGPVADTSVRWYRMGDVAAPPADEFTASWPDFAENQCGAPGTGAEGTTCGAFVSGSAWVSQHSMAATPGVTYRVSGWTKQASTRHLLFCFYDIAPYTSASIGDTTLFDNRIGTPTTLHDAVTSVWTAFTADVVAPAGTLSMGLAVVGSGGLSADEIKIVILGSTYDSAYTLPATGTSPFFARSDDPRIENIADLQAVNYLVGTAASVLDSEIVVGTTPGGELGGTWAAPTVDATHAGTTHSASTDTHIADASDAHDASSISVLDTAGHFTGTEVETVLDELADSIAAGGIPATIFDAKGDIIAASAADTAVRLAAAANGAALVTASGESTGLKWRLNNDAASAAPAVTDDSGDGYSIGSRWLDTTNDKEYVALDVTAGAAVWLETTLGAGSGFTSWTQDVNESGTSFANFTAGTGTWASDGTNISQTDTAAAFQEAKFTAKVATGLPTIIEAEMRFPTTGAGAGANRLGGLTIGFDGADIAAAYGVRLDEAADQLIMERVGAANLRVFTPTIAKDVWYKMRVVRGSDFSDIYLDGVLQGTTYSGDSAYDRVADFVGIYSFGTRVDFRNIKVWTLRGGIPA